MRRKALLLALCATSACSFTGCASWSSSDKSNSGFNVLQPSTWFEQEYQTPASVAVIWSPDILTVSGQPPMRGFGGRVFFYNNEMTAVPVEGDLTIHGFFGEEEEHAGPADKKFTFKAEQLVNHFSPGELGASYSIWVPWDKAGGERESITLVATFKSKDGHVVQGASAKLALPGKTPGSSETLPAKSPMQTISYKRSITPGNVPYRKPTTRTTTIDVPRDSGLSQRTRGFTLGGRKSNDPQSIQVGSQAAGAKASAISVGGGSSAAAPAAPTEGLKVQGLSKPPALPAANLPANGTLAEERPTDVVPASYQSGK